MKPPVLAEKKEYCCGCGACVNTCNANAIDMKCDEYGFEYPSINENKCVGCGKCMDICPYISNNNHYNEPVNTFAAVSKNTDIMDSASGGVFASIATEFLKRGGVVAGSAIENINGKLVPHHITVDNHDKLQSLLGSKYVQSDTTGIFNEIKKYLCENRQVLFSGTPCQVDALYSFLKKDHDNLFTIDLICHGVPSRKMFSDYLDFIGDKYGKVKDFIFRDKKRGLTYVSRTICEKNSKENVKYIQYGESAYYTFFLQGNTFRDCCYECKYANKKRIGDITIGDFWGIKTQHPELFNSNHKEFDADKGISCLLENTPKGKELINTYGTGLSLHPSTFNKIALENKQLSKPSVPKGNRTEIMKIYKTGGYAALNRYYRNQAGISIYISKIKSKIPLPIKKMLKK